MQTTIFRHERGRARRHRSRSIAVAVALMAALLANETASARTQLVTLVGSNIQTVSDASVQVLEFDGGRTSIDFVLADPATVAFYFSGECSVAASDDATWLDVDIRVDGVTQAPTTGDNAFCTSKDTLVGGHWVSASADAVGTFGAGSHTVDVRAVLQGWGASESWRLAEKTLVILIAEDD